MSSERRERPYPLRSKQQLIGQAEALCQSLRALRAELRPAGAETRLPASVVAHVCRQAEQCEILMECISRELQAHHQLEESLSEQQRLFETVLMQVIEGIVIRDVAGQVTFANPAATRMARKSPVGTDLTEAEAVWGESYDTGGAQLPVSRWPVSRALRGETARSVELHRIGLDGQRQVVLLSATPLLDAQARLTGAVSVLTDITERKRAEEALAKSQTLLEAIVEQVGDAIVACDHTGRFTFLNRAARRLARGHDLANLAADSLPSILGEVYDAAGRQVDPQKYPLARAMRGETVDGWEARCVSAQLGERHILVSAAPLQSEQHETGGAVATYTDITRLKQTEAALRAAVADRETLFRELRHRFRNNLQILSALLEMQADGVQSDEAREALEAARSRVQSMAHLHERLYHTLESGAVPMAGYLRDLGQALRTTYGRPEVALEIAAEEVSLDVDRALSCGFLVNELVTNAFKHAFPRGRGGAIAIRLAQEGDQCELTVADTGVGLPPSLDLETAASLGMRILRTVRQKLGGALTLRRAPHTVFTLTFPAGTAEQKAA